MKKRIISLLLALIMVVSLLPMSVLALEDAQTQGGEPAAKEDIDTGKTVPYGYLKNLQIAPQMKNNLPESVFKFDVNTVKYNIALPDSGRIPRFTVEIAEKYVGTSGLSMRILDSNGKKIGENSIKGATGNITVMSNAGTYFPVGKCATITFEIGLKGKDGTYSNSDRYTLNVTRSLALSSFKVTQENGSDVILSPDKVTAGVIDTAYQAIVPTSSEKIILTIIPASRSAAKVSVAGEEYMTLPSNNQYVVDLTKLTAEADGSYKVPFALQYKDTDAVGADSNFILTVVRKDLQAEITRQPEGVICGKGDVRTLSVEAKSRSEGGVLSYQWCTGMNQATAKPINGATEPVYTIQTDHAYQQCYVCLVTNTVDGKKYVTASDYAMVTVNPTYITEPTLAGPAGGGECMVGEATLALTANIRYEDLFGLQSIDLKWYKNATNSTDGGMCIGEHSLVPNTYLGEHIDSFVPAAEENAGTYYYYYEVTISAKDASVKPVTKRCENTISITYKSLDDLIAMDGAGTESNPYQVKSVDDLLKIKKLVNKDGYSLENQHFKLMENITLPNDWTPIGCTKDGTNNIDKGANLNAFSGILDGNNKLLTVPKGGLPLLGYIKGATVKNLNIYGEQIDGYGLVNNFEGVGLSGSAIVIDNVTLKSGTKTLKAGLIGANITTNGFAGNSASFVATIRNCSIEKDVIIGYQGNQDRIGSFAGRFQGTIENCVSYATVKGVDYVGGIMGTRDNAMGRSEINGCKFYGTVEATGKYAGGIVGGGYDNGTAPNGVRPTIQNCVSTGTITGNEHVGGILGGDGFVAQAWNSYDLTGNTFSGKVSGNKNVGAIIGYYRSLNKFDNIAGNAYLEDCGAEKGIGAVDYVDTSYANPTPVDGVLYFNTAKGTENCPEVKWCNWKANLNRTDDPLGADADKLTVAVKDASTPVCYKLGISGDYKTTYTVGDSLDFSGAVITAHWTMGKADTILNAKDITITGFDTNTRGQQTVTLSYGAAKAEITVTVLLPVGKDITVTFSLLGDSAHGNSGGKHTLADGNLEKWIDGVTVTVGNNATVLDVITKALGSKYIIENETGNYIQSITPKGGTALGEFTNGNLSGWMYTLNGKHSDLGVAQQYLMNGDVIVFHYTDDYSRENAFDQQKSADEVITMIAAIGTVSLSKGAAISQARTAYDKLSADEKALVTNYDKLLAAEAAYAKLVAEMGKKLDEIYKTTGNFMATLGTPTVNSTGGEWMVIGLTRSGRTVPAGYYDNVVEYVKAMADANERLHRAKVTDNARVILALTSIGKDVTNVGGHNLLKGLDNMAYVQTQGINGPIFTLIALDSHNYPTMGDVTREKLIQVILDAQLSNGGWTLSGTKADPDMTAMAIQALAPYYKTNETVKAAVDKALEALSALQRNDGGFGSWGTVNSESCAQVIVALTALGIDPTADSRFVKNDLTVLDALASFYVTGGGFKHVADKGRDGMATEQGYYALAAYYRFVNAQTRLYDMSDVTIQTGGSNTPATGDTGVLVWVIALPVTILAAAFALKRKEREA